MKTMYASVLRLSRADCKILEIKDAYSIHKVVYTLFPKAGDDGRDFLYADKGGNFNTRQILLLSRRPPQVPQFGSIETKQIHENFLKHDRYAFEVRMNPTKRSKESGKTVPVHGSNAEETRKILSEWFIAKAASFGCSIDSKHLQVEDVGVQVFERDGTTVTQGKASFKGNLEVTDREKFIKAFCEGLGRAKGFGFGLLQIVPIV